MKKIVSFLTLSGLVFLISCGPSAEEKAAAEKARQDSINAVVEKMKNDSIVAAAAEQARVDSIAMAAKADSIAKATAVAEAAAKKKASAKPVHKPSVKGPDTRTQTTKEADKKVENAFDKFKKK